MSGAGRVDEVAWCARCLTQGRAPTGGQEAGVHRLVVTWFVSPQGCNAAHIEPGKLWPSGHPQNGYAESFHSRLRDEFLDGEVFLSVLEAQVRLDIWRKDYKDYKDYNEERLHSSLGYLTPNEFTARWAAEALNRSKTKAALGP